MKKTVKFNFEANYYISSEINAEVKEMWFVLHGYGQLPQYFINKFNSIATKDRVIVAPGGLSQFYLEGFSGKVGATWMTKEERLLDIDNYVSYLHAVLEDVYLGNSQCKITLLGFSQGAATVVRWIQNFRIDFHQLVLWSGAFPHDMEIPTVRNKLRDKKIWMLRGDNDPFLTKERINDQSELIQKLNLPMEYIEFKGGHDIDEATLQLLLQKN
jgi:predicted esterase